MEKPSESADAQEANEGKVPMLLEYARNLIEAAPVGIRTYDLSGQCVSANSASARILGASIELLLSQNYLTVGVWQDSGLLDAAQRTMSTGRSHRIIERVATGFGEETRLDNQFERFTSGNRHYLLQVIVDGSPGGCHGD